jgi:hypothetical protein
VGLLTVEIVVEPGVVGLREGDDELACHTSGHAHITCLDIRDNLEARITFPGVSGVLYDLCGMWHRPGRCMVLYTGMPSLTISDGFTCHTQWDHTSKNLQVGHTLISVSSLCDVGMRRVPW